MKLDYPATERNREPLWAALAPRLPVAGQVLEIASGSGQHAAWFAAQRPDLTWHPSSPEADQRASIDAWCAARANVRAAVALDVLGAWPEGPFDAVFCANMIHIAPWACTPALMHGAARVLAADGLLALYGPFHVDGRATAPSNARFDASLQARDPAWGVRHREAVVAEAVAAGLELVEVLAMPANNQLLWFRRGVSGAVRPAPGAP